MRFILSTGKGRGVAFSADKLQGCCGITVISKVKGVKIYGSEPGEYMNREATEKEMQTFLSFIRDRENKNDPSAYKKLTLCSGERIIKKDEWDGVGKYVDPNVSSLFTVKQFITTDTEEKTGDTHANMYRALIDGSEGWELYDTNFNPNTDLKVYTFGLNLGRGDTLTNLNKQRKVAQKAETGEA